MFSVQLMTEVQSELMDCQSQCSRKLGMFRADKNEDFFGSYFHYLEYGYYYCELNKRIHAHYNYTYIAKCKICFETS